MRIFLFTSSAVLALVLPALAAAETASGSVVDTVIVTGRRDPEDPPVVGDARQRLSQTPGAVSVISQESYIRREALALDDMSNGAQSGPPMGAEKDPLFIALRGGEARSHA